MVVATRRAVGDAAAAAAGSSSSSGSSSTMPSSLASSNSKASESGSGSGSKRSWGERLALEAGLLLLLAGMELAWWHLRGRFSFAPRGTEAEDATSFLTFALQCYAGARAALLVVGAGLGLIRKLPTPIRILFWTACFGAGGSLAWARGGGLKGLEKLAKTNQYTYVLFDYLTSPEQQEFFKGEGFLVGRILVALLAWQLLLTVAYYALALLLAPFNYLFGGSSSSPEEEGVEKQQQQASKKPAAKGVIAMEERED